MTAKRKPAPAGADASTEERILDAATELFAERGFARTTIRQIADRAAANSALIYYYFGSKGGLLESMVARMHGGVRANLERTAELSGTPRQQLERFIRLQVVLLRKRAPLLRFVLREILSRNEIVLGMIRQAVDVNLGRVVELIEEGKAAGEFRDVDAHLAARTLMGSLMVPIVVAPLVVGEDDAETAERLPDHIVAAYLGGIVS